MGFLKEIKGWLGLNQDSVTRVDEVNEEDNPLFVYIKIPADMKPMDRGDLFEDPLQEALEKDGLGTITGGGSQLLEEDSNKIDFCGIDVDLYEAAQGLELLRREMIRLNAPPGTVLIYELNGHEWEEPVHRQEN